MPNPIMLDNEQLTELDKVIDALKSGEMSEDEFRQTLIAPPVNQQQTRGVSPTLTISFTLTLATIVTMVGASDRIEKSTADTLAEIPPGQCLDKLLELRRLATTPNKGNY